MGNGVPTQEDLKGRFSYSEDHHTLCKRECVGGLIHEGLQGSQKRRNGSFAGSINGMGYVYAWCFGKQHKLTRLVWIYHHGAIPEGKVVDHINRDPLDNRISNLRLATRHQNSINHSKQAGTSSKFIGVYKTKEGKWIASINGSMMHGLKGRQFETEEEAAMARDRIAWNYHGEFASLNFPERFRDK